MDVNTELFTAVLRKLSRLHGGRWIDAECSSRMISLLGEVEKAYIDEPELGEATPDA